LWNQCSLTHLYFIWLFWYFRKLNSSRWFISNKWYQWFLMVLHIHHKFVSYLFLNRNFIFERFILILGRRRGSFLLMEEIGAPRENHRPAVSHWQTLSHNVVSSTPHLRDEVCQWSAVGLWFSLRTLVLLPPRYNWIIVESGIKHHKPTNQPIT
jgi:hypothetical protein